MRRSWVLLLAAILAVVLFNRFLVPAKNNLIAAITLNDYEKPALVQQSGRTALIAKIYSDYPFNHHSLLTIAAGTADGVVVGMPLTTDGNFLLGQITEVFDHHSVARTIFDNNWKLSTRIGESAADALLVGGQNPLLTLIDKKSALQDGDLVYSAGRDFPYGLKIGQLASLQDSAATSFRQANLVLPYQLNNLKEAVILLK